VQDKANWNRLTVNLGLRYDNPQTIDGNTGKKLLNFDNFSPRLSLTYDLSGKGTTILGAPTAGTTTRSRRTDPPRTPARGRTP
jgi:hypothetical protein